MTGSTGSPGPSGRTPAQANRGSGVVVSGDYSAIAVAGGSMETPAVMVDAVKVVEMGKEVTCTTLQQDEMEEQEELEDENEDEMGGEQEGHDYIK